MPHLPRILIFACLVFSCQLLQAVTVVRYEVQQGASINNMDLVLFDSVAPLTVVNFLNYVNDGRLDDSLFHRNAVNFVIQGGGYTFRVTDPSLDFLDVITPEGPLQLVPTDPSVVNEFNILNTTGTIAMAKVSGNPDSATSQWFINMADNTSLNIQNGGFTVFGEVVDDGMDVAFSIMDKPIQTFAGSVLGAAFNELPVVDYDFLSFPKVFRENLVMINSISEHARPVMKLSSKQLDLGLILVNTSSELIVTATNNGNDAMNIGVIDAVTLGPEYAITNDNCSSQILQPVPDPFDPLNPPNSCTFGVTYIPTTNGLHAGNLQIPYENGAQSESYAVTIQVKGESVPTTPVLVASPASQDLGIVAINATEIGGDITILNRGGGSITFNEVSLQGVDASLFGLTHNCIIGLVLNFNQSCTVNVSFTPTTTGAKSANIRIDTTAGIGNVVLAGSGEKPILSASVTALDLGNGFVGGAAVSQDIIVQNLGIAALNINNLSLTGPDAAEFTQLNNCPSTNTTPTPQFLGFAGTCLIRVFFVPLTNGAKTATLVIDSNDTDNPIINIPLTGTGLSGGQLDINPSDTLDFGGVLLASNDINDVIILNSGSVTSTIVINQVTLLDDAEGNFFIDSVCAVATVLNGADNCTASIRFTPLTIGAKTANLEIDTSEGVVTIALSGFGLVAIISAPVILDVGEGSTAIVTSGLFHIIDVSNIGNTTLTVTGVSISGSDASDFQAFNNCTLVAPGEFCTIGLKFFPQTTGVKSAVLVINSTDIDNPTISVVLTGYATDNLDIDGVGDAEEDAGSNNGDGNNDDVLDSTQENITSLLGENGEYVTLVAPVGAQFSDVKRVVNPSPADTPGGVNFLHGIISYNIVVTNPGSVVDVGMILPMDTTPGFYYRYGPTPDNPVPHWYDFTFDGVTGVQYLPASTITSPAGNQITRNLLFIRYVDGLRGDDDLVANGVIVDPGGPATVSQAAGNGGGGLNLWLLAFMVIVRILLCGCRRHIKTY